MPEFPDVELYKQRFEAHALHRRIESVVLRDRPLLSGASAQALQKALLAHRFVISKRHGKYLFLGIDTGRWLAAHFGMSGALEYADSEDESVQYERLRLVLEHGGRLSYTSRRRLGRITLIDDPQAFIEEKRLGPDALGIAAREFETRFGTKRGTVKSALMDQTTLAGIGNIYSDEVLFQSGLHPRTPVERLEKKSLAQLYRTTQRVLQAAVEAEADPHHFPDGFLTPHRREGAVCPRCGGTVKRMQIGGRSSYFCERCQPPLSSGSRRPERV